MDNVEETAIAMALASQDLIFECKDTNRFLNVGLCPHPSNIQEGDNVLAIELDDCIGGLDNWVYLNLEDAIKLREKISYYIEYYKANVKPTKTMTKRQIEEELGYKVNIID